MANLDRRVPIYLLDSLWYPRMVISPSRLCRFRATDQVCYYSPVWQKDSPWHSKGWRQTGLPSRVFPLLWWNQTSRSSGMFSVRCVYMSSGRWLVGRVAWSPLYAVDGETSVFSRESLLGQPNRMGLDACPGNEPRHRAITPLIWIERPMWSDVFWLCSCWIAIE